MVNSSGRSQTETGSINVLLADVGRSSPSNFSGPTLNTCAAIDNKGVSQSIGQPGETITQISILSSYPSGSMFMSNRGFAIANYGTEQTIISSVGEIGAPGQRFFYGIYLKGSGLQTVESVGVVKALEIGIGNGDYLNSGESNSGSQTVKSVNSINVPQEQS